MKNKKFAVIGGLGFIGSHLVERLSPENEVLIIDDESSGKLENIKHLDLTNIDVTLGDITKINLVELLDGCDYVLHHAAMASVPLSIDNPLRCNEVNVTGTLRILEASREVDVKKVVFASSSAVYGDSSQLPVNESLSVNPLSPYAVSKVAGELYCSVYSQIYGLPTTALRYFNVFGPRQDPDSQYAAVIPKFIESLLKNEPPTIYGDGMQTRDFIHIKHVVDANLQACQSSVSGNFNIAGGKSISIQQLYEIIRDIIGSNIEPRYTDPRSGEIKHSWADISHAKEFGFNPDINLINELEETIMAYKTISK
ncbi:MAG: SDR family oxidoreductase [Methanobacteriaceae archaeon]|nr:SDR family oxidoreductase [Methanobacteriaceae archaeon]